MIGHACTSTRLHSDAEEFGLGRGGDEGAKAVECCRSLIYSRNLIQQGEYEEWEEGEGQTMEMALFLDLIAARGVGGAVSIADAAALPLPLPSAGMTYAGAGCASKPA